MKKVVYDQKFDAKIIIYAVTIIVIIGFIMCLYIGIKDKIYKENNCDFYILLSIPFVSSLIAAIPIIIILRYKLIIDLDNNILIYRGYFKKTKKYDLDKVSYQKRVKSQGNPWLETVYYIKLIYKNKKICIVDSSDFSHKTNQSLENILEKRLIC